MFYLINVPIFVTYILRLLLPPGHLHVILFLLTLHVLCSFQEMFIYSILVKFHPYKH